MLLIDVEEHAEIQSVVKVAEGQRKNVSVPRSKT